MPAIYAHHRFGEYVASQLNKEMKDLIKKHEKEFSIGLQGPDVFLFYRPWKQNELIEYGTHLHRTPARWMFQRGMGNGRNSAAYAYMLGVVCHYVLDNACHAYIAEHEAATGVSHMEIESEFEKMLMRKCGNDPFSYRTDFLIPIDEDTSATLYEFYDVYDEAKMRFALRWMRNFKQLFIEPRPWAKQLLNGMMTITGYGKYKGQILQLKDNPACAESNEQLYRLCKEAIPRAVDMIYELDQCKQSGEALSEKWDYTFA